MSVVRILKNANTALEADAIFDRLEKDCAVRGISYPASREARIRLLQRDINTISEVMYIDIRNIRNCGYIIKSFDNDPPLDYDKLFADFDLLTAVQPDAKVNEYLYPDHHRGKGSSNLFPLLMAAKNREKVSFTYRFVRKRGKEIHYLADPYFLKENQQRWYLVAEADGKIRLFELDRITDLELTGERFKRNPEISEAGMFDNSYGIWNAPEIPVEEIELRYSPLDGEFLKEVPLHHSQQILADNDKEFRITVKLRITNDFVMALLSRANSLEVIRPLHLRERIKDVCSRCAERNK